MTLVTLSLVLVGCGESTPGGPRTCEEGAAAGAPLTYCDNPCAKSPTCSLLGYSMANDSALRTKLESCGATGCHGTDGTAVTTWNMDLSGPSVESALAPLETVIALSGQYVVDELDADCSNMLTKVTDKPGSGQRMPLAPPHWTGEETDCFRSYLHEMYPPPPPPSE